MPKPPSDEEILARLDESVALDVLEVGYPRLDVAAELKEAGGDPEAIGLRGAAFVHALLEQRRLAWQARARHQQAAWRSEESQLADAPRRPRSETLARINTLRSDPKLAPIVANFHKRKPEDASDDELHQLLIEMELLRRRGPAKADDEK